MSTKTNLVADFGSSNNPYSVKIVNKSRWIQLDQTTYYTFGGQLSIPLTFIDGSDYTCVNASSGSLTANGHLDLNVTGDDTVILEDTKTRLHVSNMDTEAVRDVTYQGTSLITSFVFVQKMQPVLLTVTYNSTFDYSGSVSDQGTVTQNGIELTPAETDITITISPRQVNVQLCNGVPWCSTSSSVSAVRYGKNWQQPLSFTESGNYSSVAANGQNLSSSTVYSNNVTGGTTVTLTATKAQVKFSPDTEIVSGFSSGNYIYSPFNSTCTNNVNMKSPFTASDISVTGGTLSGNQISVNVGSSTQLKYDVHVKDALKYTELGKTETTFNYIPVYPSYYYSVAQMIYTASEIGRAGTIRGIGFYVNGSAYGGYVVNAVRSLRVYTANVSRSSFSNGSDFTTFSSSYYNYYGNVTIKQGWVFIPFTSRTFAYDGTSNLLIYINDNTGSQNYTYPSFWCYSNRSEQSYSSIYAYSYNTSYNPSYQYSGNTAYYKPMLRINFA